MLQLLFWQPLTQAILYCNVIILFLLSPACPWCFRMPLIHSLFTTPCYTCMQHPPSCIYARIIDPPHSNCKKIEKNITLVIARLYTINCNILFPCSDQ